MITITYEPEIIKYDRNKAYVDPEWVLPGLRAGQIGLLCAPGGTGKSFLLPELGMSVAAGHSIIRGLPINYSGPVRYLNFEDDALEMSNRGNAILRNFQPDEIPDPESYFFSSLSGEYLPLVNGKSEESVAAIVWLTSMCLGMRLVMLDPLRLLHTGNENDSGNVAVLVQVLQRIAQNTGAAILIAHHTSKAATLSGQGDLQQSARGSSALVDGVRLVMTLDRDQDSKDLRLSWAKQNGGRPIDPITLVRMTDGVLLSKLPNCYGDSLIPYKRAKKNKNI